MSDDIVERLRKADKAHLFQLPPFILIEAADEIERLRVALQTSHMQLAAKMAGKSALSDEKHMAILLAAVENTHEQCVQCSTPDACNKLGRCVARPRGEHR